MRQHQPLTAQAAPVSTLAERESFADAVAYYLVQRPRQLPSRYFYDPLGSALFEAICRLPWYPVTSAEKQLLRHHACDIVRRMQPLTTIIELGSGSGEKLGLLIEAGGAESPLTIHLVDVSAAALASASDVLARVPSTTIVAHQASYEVGMAEIARQPRPTGHAMVLFLGSNIGNFDPPGAAAFVRSIRASLTPGDSLLLGADLVKSAAELVLAYDDPLGVTAAFNRNLLVRINRELGGDFDLDRFAHRAIWNAEHSRVEMHLVCTRRQRVRVAAAGLDFTMEKGESIWTESSYKYQPFEIVELLEDGGFTLVEQWTDGGFALTLATRSGS